MSPTTDPLQETPEKGDVLSRIRSLPRDSAGNVELWRLWALDDQGLPDLEVIENLEQELKLVHFKGIKTDQAAKIEHEIAERVCRVMYGTDEARMRRNLVAVRSRRSFGGRPRRMARARRARRCSGRTRGSRRVTSRSPGGGSSGDDPPGDAPEPPPRRQGHEPKASAVLS